MQTKINIKSVEQQEQALIFYAENADVEAKELQPRGHVLVDSDNLAFLYILENEQDYVYVSLSQELWPVLKKSFGSEVEMIVSINDVRIPLEGLEGEIGYLIRNIEGNANYGEELVKKVEEIFLF